jgi:hypothetical protein
LVEVEPIKAVELTCASLGVDDVVFGYLAQLFEGFFRSQKNTTVLNGAPSTAQPGRSTMLAGIMNTS